MPSEYEALVEALTSTEIPFAEYGWKTRPDGMFGVVGLDYEAGSLEGDGLKQDRSFGGSVDLYYRNLSDRAGAMGLIEAALVSCLGDGWELNSVQFETETGLFHVEWTFEVTGTIAAPEPDGGA